MQTENAELVTLYTGVDVSEADAERLRARIEERYPNVAVEIVTGGQPHYDFIVSVE
jgi:dihydroxyacetone kinase-like predicted kinase